MYHQIVTLIASLAAVALLIPLSFAQPRRQSTGKKGSAKKTGSNAAKKVASKAKSVTKSALTKKTSKKEALKTKSEKKAGSTKKGDRKVAAKAGGTKKAKMKATGAKKTGTEHVAAKKKSPRSKKATVKKSSGPAPAAKKSKRDVTRPALPERTEERGRLTPDDIDVIEIGHFPFDIPTGGDSEEGSHGGLVPGNGLGNGGP